MQLISIILLCFAVLSFIFAINFLWSWQRADRYESLLSPIGKNIGYHGITMVTAYPSTLRPLSAMIEEQYPRSEAILICDMQRNIDIFGKAIRRFHLVRVNHDHLKGVRTLYRSRQRAFRRIVIVDIPLEERSYCETIAREVASYGYILYTEGDIIIESGIAAHCINLIASQPITTPLTLSSIVDGSAKVQPSDTQRAKHHTIARPIAWRERCNFRAFSFVCITASLLIVVGGSLFRYTIAFYSATIAVIIYISCRIVSQKNLFIRFDTILHNFCRYIVDFIKRICYLYKRESAAIQDDYTVLWRIPKQLFLRNNRSQL